MFIGCTATLGMSELVAEADDDILVENGVFNSGKSTHLNGEF